MVVLFISAVLGAAVTAAALLVFPYRVRFARRRDKMAFIFTVGLAGTFGATMLAGAGSMLLLESL